MPLVVLNAVIQTPLKGQGLSRKLPAMTRTSLRATGVMWHGKLLEKHFTPGNDQRYGFEPRNKYYMKNIKTAEGVGPGRFVMLRLKGKSLRWMQQFPTITATSHQCVVRMVTPTYFDKPFIGTSINPRTGRLTIVSRQPDKPKEATAVNSADNKTMTAFFKNDLEFRAQLALRGI